MLHISYMQPVHAAILPYCTTLHTCIPYTLLNILSVQNVYTGHTAAGTCPSTPSTILIQCTSRIYAYRTLCSTYCSYCPYVHTVHTAAHSCPSTPSTLMQCTSCIYVPYILLYILPKKSILLLNTAHTAAHTCPSTPSTILTQCTLPSARPTTNTSLQETKI